MIGSGRGWPEVVRFLRINGPKRPDPAPERLEHGAAYYGQRWLCTANILCALLCLELLAAFILTFCYSGLYQREIYRSNSPIGHSFFKAKPNLVEDLQINSVRALMRRRYLTNTLYTMGSF